MGDLSTFELIGLAFTCGYLAKNSLEENEKEDNKTEKVEIKKITPKEMGDILDGLKNKIMGEEE